MQNIRLWLKPDSAKSSSSNLDRPDEIFVKKAAEGGLAEVELGQLAQQKEQSEDVKQFGKLMVEDHSKVNEQLKTLATQKGVNLPDKLDAKDQATKNRLEKLSGEQFDKAYMRDMVKDHTKDVAEFQKEAKSAKDPDVKAFASQTLPTLESHLQQAKQIAPKESREAKSQKSKAGQ